MSTVDARTRHLRSSARLVAALLIAVVLLVVAGVLVKAATHSVRGLDTTCGDFMKMSDDEQLEVIRESDRFQGTPDLGVDYFVEVCPQGADEQLKYFNG